MPLSSCDNVVGGFQTCVQEVFLRLTLAFVVASLVNHIVLGVVSVFGLPHSFVCLFIWYRHFIAYIYIYVYIVNTIYNIFTYIYIYMYIYLLSRCMHTIFRLSYIYHMHIIPEGSFVVTDIRMAATSFCLALSKRTARSTRPGISKGVGYRSCRMRPPVELAFSCLFVGGWMVWCMVDITLGKL